MVELLLDLNIPASYICRKSYAMWDVLLPDEGDSQQAVKDGVQMEKYPADSGLP